MKAQGRTHEYASAWAFTLQAILSSNFSCTCQDPNSTGLLPNFSVCSAVQQNVPNNGPDPTTAQAQGSGTCARASLLSWRRQKQRAPEAERLQNPSDSQAAELRAL